VASTAICPRCGHQNYMPACQNCGGVDFVGPSPDRLHCKSCGMQFTQTPCQAGCGAVIFAQSFAAPSQRLGARIAAGINASRGGGCFIATELYGSESYEVLLLRAFRDQVLLRRQFGPGCVAVYYRVAPRIVLLMRRSTLARRTIHALVGVTVALVRLVAQQRGSGQLQDVGQSATHRGKKRPHFPSRTAA
jgi:hypothetical protein